jgi:hypothetical protein
MSEDTCDAPLDHRDRTLIRYRVVKAGAAKLGIAADTLPSQGPGG